MMQCNELTVNIFVLISLNLTQSIKEAPNKLYRMQ